MIIKREGHCSLYVGKIDVIYLISMGYNFLFVNNNTDEPYRVLFNNGENTGVKLYKDTEMRGITSRDEEITTIINEISINEYYFLLEFDFDKDYRTIIKIFPKN